MESGAVEDEETVEDAAAVKDSGEVEIGTSEDEGIVEEAAAAKDS